jgi:hypothetical protein
MAPAINATWASSQVGVQPYGVTAFRADRVSRLAVLELGAHLFPDRAQVPIRLRSAILRSAASSRALMV